MQTGAAAEVNAIREQQHALHIRIYFSNYVHSAGITVGYIQTAVSVPESAGVAQLTVAISVSPQGDQIDTSFFLLVNTNDGTAAGLLSLIYIQYTLPGA